MFQLIHTTIRALLHQEASFPGGQVDIVFRAPEKAWVEQITPPTLVFYLHELRENTELRRPNPTMTRGGSTAISRAPLRLFDARYVVCAFDREQPENEYTLLWNTLAVLLKHSPLPPEMLTDDLRAFDQSIATKIIPDDERRLIDLWQALGMAPRPALVYAVTLPLDLEHQITWPIIRERTSGYGVLPPRHGQIAHPLQALMPPDERRSSSHGIIEGVVLDQHRRPVPEAQLLPLDTTIHPTVTNREGCFILSGVPSGELVLELSSAQHVLQRVSLHVPSERYEIVLDNS